MGPEMPASDQIPGEQQQVMFTTGLGWFVVLRWSGTREDFSLCVCQPRGEFSGRFRELQMKCSGKPKKLLDSTRRTYRWLRSLAESELRWE